MPTALMNPMRIAITGATGMIGQALTPFLTGLGHRVVPVSRRLLPGGIQWEPRSAQIDPADWEGLDAVIHLAGENLADGRWTAARKRELHGSRVGPTRLLARTLAALSDPPDVLISASAIGIYGDRGDTVLTESASGSKDFLGSLATDWEQAADPARDAGIRVVHPRLGIVLTSTGGALAKMLPTARLGLGAPMGSGEQWWSWVAIDDLLGACIHLLDHPEISGPVNVTAPGAVRNSEFAATLGRVLGRPVIFPVPALLLKIMLGEMAEAALLASTRVVPAVLEASGYHFAQPELSGALIALLSRDQ